MASGSLDVPVTTSERFLRAAVDPEVPVPDDLRPALLPEEHATIDALAARLGLEDPREAPALVGALHEELAALSDRLDELDADLDRAGGALAAELLHRWPVLDDPWHPDFEETFRAEHAAIAQHLETSGVAAEERRLAAERAEVAAAHDDVLVRTAPLERLARGLETVDLAARLQADGGRFWLRYLAFLACERGEL